MDERITGVMVYYYLFASANYGIFVMKLEWNQIMKMCSLEKY